MLTMAVPVTLVVSGTTRLLSNSPAHSHSRSLTIVVAISNQTNQINYDTSQLYHGLLMVWCCTILGLMMSFLRLHPQKYGTLSVTKIKGLYRHIHTPYSGPNKGLIQHQNKGLIQGRNKNKLYVCLHTLDSIVH